MTARDEQARLAPLLAGAPPVTRVSLGCGIHRAAADWVMEEILEREEREC